MGILRSGLICINNKHLTSAAFVITSVKLERKNERTNEPAGRQTEKGRQRQGNVRKVRQTGSLGKVGRNSGKDREKGKGRKAE